MKTKKIDLNSFPKDKFTLISKKKGIGTFAYVPSNYQGPIAQDAIIKYESKKG